VCRPNPNGCAILAGALCSPIVSCDDFLAIALTSFKVNRQPSASTWGFRTRTDFCAASGTTSGWTYPNRSFHTENTDLRCSYSSMASPAGMLTFHFKLFHPNHFFDKAGIEISSQKVCVLHDFCLKRNCRFNSGDQVFTECSSHSTNRPGAGGAHTNQLRNHRIIVGRDRVPGINM
jgi:hypothetical protein